MTDFRRTCTSATRPRFDEAFIGQMIYEEDTGQVLRFDGDEWLVPSPRAGQLWSFGQPHYYDKCSVRATLRIDGETYVVYKCCGVNVRGLIIQDIISFLREKRYVSG